jgi:hypothetical protein
MFCFIVMRSTEPGCFRLYSWCLWKVFDEEGCLGLVPWRLDVRCKSSWIFWRNWNVPLVLLERSWWEGFNGIYLVRFGFKMWDISIFKWFLPLIIQINSQKTRFWKENLIENVVTFEGLALNSTMISFHIWLFKKWIYTLQNTVHMLSFSIL